MVNVFLCVSALHRIWQGQQLPSQPHINLSITAREAEGPWLSIVPIAIGYTTV